MASKGMSSTNVTTSRLQCRVNFFHLTENPILFHSGIMQTGWWDYNNENVV